MHKNFVNPIATVTTEPQSTNDLTSTNPAMITTSEVNVTTTGSTFTTSEVDVTTTSSTFTTSEVDVTTTGSTFTTSKISSTYSNISQDPNSANNTVTGLPGKSCSTHVILNTILLPSDPDETKYEDGTGPFRNKTSLAIGVAASVLVIFIVTLIIIVLLLVWKYKRRYQTKLDADHYKVENSYSRLYRGSDQMQPQSHHTHAELYDQTQLSPSTGQAEIVPKNERKTTPPPQTSYPIYTSVDTNPHCLLNIDATEEPKQTQDATTEREADVASVPTKNYPQLKDEQKQRQDLEEMYAVVNKKSKQDKASAEFEKTDPQISEFYTAVKKKTKGSAAEDEEEAPPLPPHTVEELYTAVQKKND